MGITAFATAIFGVIAAKDPSGLELQHRKIVAEQKERRLFSELVTGPAGQSYRDAKGNRERLDGEISLDQEKLARRSLSAIGIFLLVTLVFLWFTKSKPSGKGKPLTYPEIHDRQ